MRFVGTSTIFFALVNYMKIVPFFALGQFSADNMKTSLFLMPRGREDLAKLLAAVVGLLLFLSLAGVLLAPELSIHQAADINEPQLARDWRGVFAHKNTAGAVFAMAVFMMIYAIRTGLIVPGSVLLALTVLFVAMSGA